MSESLLLFTGHELQMMRRCIAAPDAFLMTHSEVRSCEAVLRMAGEGKVVAREDGVLARQLLDFIASCTEAGRMNRERIEPTGSGKTVKHE